eukprot:5274991-Prymnesium_polylepis.1
MVHMLISSARAARTRLPRPLKLFALPHRGRARAAGSRASSSGWLLQHGASRLWCVERRRRRRRRCAPRQTKPRSDEL